MGVPDRDRLKRPWRNGRGIDLAARRLENRSAVSHRISCHKMTAPPAATNSKNISESTSIETFSLKRGVLVEAGARASGDRLEEPAAKPSPIFGPVSSDWRQPFERSPSVVSCSSRQPAPSHPFYRARQRPGPYPVIRGMCCRSRGEGGRLWGLGAFLWPRFKLPFNYPLKLIEQAFKLRHLRFYLRELGSWGLPDQFVLSKQPS
jgi:hypothetical protein